VFSKQFPNLIAGRRVSSWGVAQYRSVDTRCIRESFTDFAGLIPDHWPAEDDLISNNLQLHRQGPHRQKGRRDDQ